MPATSASQQRLFGMVHAYQKGKLKKAPKKIRELAERISEEDASHFARTSHDDLPEKRGSVKTAAAKPVGITIGKKSVVFPTMKAAVLYLASIYGIKRSEATKAIRNGASGIRGIRFFRPQTKQASVDLESLAKGYYEDGSHGWGHIQDVLSRAENIKGKPLSEDERAAILFHDSSLSTGPRETHAEDSAAIARKVLGKIYARRRLERIVRAIERHRASYKGKRTSYIQNLVSAADRDLPGADDMYLRSLQYGLEHGMSDEEAIDNAYEHIPSKYGRNGYAYRNAPKLYLDAYKDSLGDMWDKMDKTTKDDLRRMMADVKTEKRASDETKKKIDRLRKKLYRGFDSKKDWEARFPDGSTIDIRQFEKGIPQELADKVLVSGGDHFLENRRGLCHERADAEMKYLRENGIDAGRFFADLHDDYTPYWLLLDHSFPYYHDEDGYAMIGKKVKGKPQFITKREAAEQFLRNTIADGNFGGEGIHRMRIYDTTDVPMKDDESFKKFKRRMIRKGILLLDKKASDMGLAKRVTKGLA